MAKLTITNNKGILIKEINLDEYDLHKGREDSLLLLEIIAAVQETGEGRTNK